MANHNKGLETTNAIEESPDMTDPAEFDKDTYPEATRLELPPATISRITRISSILSVLVAGIALFSDGYNSQIIGYMEPLFSDL
jgi:hypothetical protein